MPPLDLATVREAVAELADEAAVDAIVSHFAGESDAGVPTGGEVTAEALNEALDAHLFFAGSAAAAPDVVDDASQLAAAAHA